MKIIELTKGYITVIDNDDFERVSEFNWCAIKEGNNQIRAMTKIDGRTVYLHRFLMNPSVGLHVDHVDGHPLNNQKANLRICTALSNSYNQRTPRTNTSGFKGVSFLKDRNRWRAYINPNRKHLNLGQFKTKEEAARAYNAAAIKYFGAYARLNNI